MSETAVKIGPGVVTGDGVQEVFRVAKENQFALPIKDAPSAGVLIPIETSAVTVPKL